MCGIAGSITWRNGPSTQLGTFDIARLAYRGPDARATLASDQLPQPPARVAWRLAHARLSVLDLAPNANQPMSTADGRYWLVYNGELYNNEPLREELRGLGHQFRTDHSDTETLLSACIEWGPACLDKLNGMFAFVFVDNLAGTVLAARDRMGIKPFYYRMADGVLTFASEPKAFLGERRADRSQLLGYFHFRQVEGTSTFYEGIRKLPAAHYFRMDGEGMPEPRRYWHPLGSSGHPRDLGDAREVMDLLTEAVDLQMVADVPVGTYLSGGLDSSLITALAARKGRIKTFSIGFRDDVPGNASELAHAATVARHLGTDHHALAISPAEYLAAQQRAFQVLDEPVADSACGPLLLLSELARSQGVVVCLSGEGADELFIGYRQWHDAYRVQRILERLPSAMARGFAAMGAPGLARRKPDWATWVRRHGNGQQIIWGGIDGMSHEDVEQVFNPDFLAGARDPYASVRPYMDAAEHRGTDLLQRLSAFDLLFRLPDHLLARVDRMSMAASLEARVPYLDHRLVERSLRLKLPLLIGPSGEKLALKEFARKLLPPAIVDRPKVGFLIPMEQVLHASEALKQRDLILAMDDALGLYGHAFREDLAQGRITGLRLWPHFALANWWELHVRTA